MCVYRLHSSYDRAQHRDSVDVAIAALVGVAIATQYQFLAATSHAADEYPDAYRHFSQARDRPTHRSPHDLT
jgi:hypothetical protein